MVASGVLGSLCRLPFEAWRDRRMITGAELLYHTAIQILQRCNNIHLAVGFMHSRLYQVTRAAGLARLGGRSAMHD